MRWNRWEVERAALGASVTSFYQADGLGSVTSLTDGSGQIAASYTYDSFGNLANSTGSTVNLFRYTARDWDSETSLYNYRAGSEEFRFLKLCGTFWYFNI